MTPATLALMTAVGPPDWATKRFPTNSAINSFNFLGGRRTTPLPPSKWNPNHANRARTCQRQKLPSFPAPCLTWPKSCFSLADPLLTTPLTLGRSLRTYFQAHATHQLQRVAFFDHAGPQPVIKAHLAVLQLVFKMEVLSGRFQFFD